jgi:cephalosporin hydroxylase
VIIEVGVKKGGQTLYLSHLMREINSQGLVLGIDVSIKSVNPRLHEVDNVRLIGSDSVGPKLHALLERKYCPEPNALVILDGVTRDHVLAELRLFQKYVPVGGYLIVNDTMINGHPIWPDWGPGPWEAVRAFLEETADFQIDKAREKHMLTSCPDGFLRRVK